MTSPPSRQEHTVSPAECGMKLMTFIERRLSESAPSSVLYKWIRTGQVRINKKRAKPFDRVKEGDCIRIPPFAKLRETGTDSSPLALLTTKIPVLYADSEFLVINKPSGLAVHPGSGVGSSVSSLLEVAYTGSSFIPAPAHRLDKNTSGLLVIGLTHSALARLSAWFAVPEDIQKNYLAWVTGAWAPSQATLEDYLFRENNGSNTNMRRVASDHPQAVYARSRVTKLHSAMYNNHPVTLLDIQLQTGRTHQIRAQLAERGFPVIGDVRYGGKEHFPMLLHAVQLSLPNGKTFTCMPDWPVPFRTESLTPYGQTG